MWISHDAPKFEAYSLRVHFTLDSLEGLGQDV